MFRTALLETFDAEVPIMNAGMGGVAWGELAGAVSAAGGIGVIGSTGMTRDQLHEEIDKARSRSDGPLVIDVVFPARAPENRDDIDVPEYDPRPVEKIRSALEERGADVPDYDEADVNLFSKEQARELLDVAIERDADGLATAVGAPEWAIEKAHDNGMTVISLAGRPRHAVYADEAGTDLVVADGTEGGGHSGPTPLIELIPSIQAVTDKPVIAAGGLTTGYHVLGALAMGTEGVWMGTRFIPTPESAAPESHKRHIIETESPLGTVRSELGDGLYIRMLRNRFTEIWQEHEDEIRDFPEQQVLNAPLREAAEQVDAGDYELHAAGMGSALIDDMPTAGEIVEELTGELEEAYDRLTTRHRG